MKRLVCAVFLVNILVLALPSCNLFQKSSADGNSDKKETEQPLNNSDKIVLPDFYLKRRGYSYSFAEILKYHPNIKVSDIFKALINTASIDDFVSKLSKSKRLSETEASIIKSYFSERASLS